MPSVIRSRFPCPSRSDVPLRDLTTFRMGGAVPLLLEPRNADELAGAVRTLRAEGITFRVLGGGANVLVDDRGLAEAVVSTRAFAFVRRDDDGGAASRSGDDDVLRLRLAAGVSIPAFVTRAREMSLEGAERLVGIPGTIGGATVMNAGGRHGALSDVAKRVRLLLASGDEDEIEVGPATFGYRSSCFGDDAVVLETVVELRPGDGDRVRETTRAILHEKRAAQPLTEASAGCVFKNPPGGSAGRLLEAAGVKGLSRGGAVVSPKHANFIVNAGGATLADVRALIAAMQDAVEAASGVRLHTEVRIWDRD